MPPSPPAATHIETLQQNVEEVHRLLEFHARLTGTKVGKRGGVEVLNKSGIVLLIACWEAFVEDLAVSAFEALLASAKDPQVFPTRVLVTAARPLRDDQDHRRVWELAGEGWRATLEGHKKQVMSRFIKGFNTPRPENVDKLFEDLIGLSKLSKHWTWTKMTSERANERLSQLVEQRGEIAHRVTAARSVHKATVKKSVDFVFRLAVVSNNAVRDYLRELTGAYPWARYSFGSVG